MSMKPARRLLHTMVPPDCLMSLPILMAWNHCPNSLLDGYGCQCMKPKMPAATICCCCLYLILPLAIAIAWGHDSRKAHRRPSGWRHCGGASTLPCCCYTATKVAAMHKGSRAQRLRCTNGWANYPPSCIWKWNKHG